MTEFHPPVDKKISNIIKRAYPEFAESDYPLFVAFMKAYYEWMETTGNPYEIISQLHNYRDVDRTTAEFLKYFKKEYIDDIPDDIVADKRNLIKKIKEFYQAKGSEKSFQLLFRILYDKAISIYYPSDDILRCSDGKWVEETVIRTTSSFSNTLLEELASRPISGVSSGASAIIENVIRFNIGSTTVTEFTISNVVGTFIPNESVISSTISGSNISETIYPIYTSINLTSGGGSYSIDDDIFIRDGDDTAQPAIATATVAKVDSNGTITHIQMGDFGIQIDNPILDFTSGGDTAFGLATGTLSTSAVGTKAGRWTNTDGFLSSNKKLQDNFFYQDFSYVIKSSISIERWRDIVKNVVHPAGMLVFGELYSETEFTSEIDINVNFDVDALWFINILTGISLATSMDVDTFREILMVIAPEATYHTTFDEVRIEQRYHFEVQDYETTEIGEVISNTIDTPIEDEYVLSARSASWRERTWASKVTIGSLDTNGEFVPD